MSNSNDSASGCGCIVFLLVYLPIAFWTDRNLDFWMTFINKQPTDIPFWISLILVIFEPVILVLNIIGEIGRYFNV
jgi:hypothetical protein